MGVIRREARWRWALVAGAVAVLCALPAIAGALPVSAPAVTAAGLRSRILASSELSYAGYAESDATFGLPPLPGLSDVTSLLDGVTRMRVWQGSPSRWRVDVLSDAGERDTYATPRSTYIWDSGSQLLTEVTGQPTIRLPRAADFVPPALAVRLLREAGPSARMTVLPPRRVAGLTASGLRVVPADPASTIGQINIWAEAANGLPLQVEIVGRGTAHPALESQFFQVNSWRPDSRILTPSHGPGTGFAISSASSFQGALNNLDPEVLPPTLAGRAISAISASVAPIGVYGNGLSIFAVLTLRGSTGRSLLSGARSAGGVPLKTAHGTGVLVTAPLLTVVLMHRTGATDTFLLAGLADRQVLEQAAATLVSRPGEDY
ncbi:MAG TPA: hypothetical protein VE733_28080 [Streptosporangiaceae bacterium]|nr:hypothetical protein [Streptosporangiaceae bacterium]